jgi:acetyl esterase/lipase
MNHAIPAAILLLLLAATPTASAQTTPFEVKIWTTPTPSGEDPSRLPETTIKIYPSAAERPGVAVLICPGGGYSRLAMQHEGEDVARWLADNNITAIVLDYRLPNHHHRVPLDDARQAMHLVRERAGEWNVDPARLGVMGFSAGGHLAATLLTRPDSLSRPDFGVLFYPVITFDPRLTHAGSVSNLLGEATDELRDYYSNEKHVSPGTPPTLLFHSNDDKSVPPENSLLFHASLRANGIPASLHVFPSGGHGWGFRPTFTYHAIMKEILLQWIRER